MRYRTGQNVRMSDRGGHSDRAEHDDDIIRGTAAGVPAFVPRGSTVRATAGILPA
jgi:hypothetical protein